MPQDIAAATPPAARARVAIIGGGPAGLMAAETLAAGGVQVDLFDAMPSVGRKFLLAGKGGLNLTHAEPLPEFTGRYAEAAEVVGGWLEQLSPQALRDWAAGLGVSTFVGSSGRVFPAEMKAAPLLRAWLHRLRASGVQFHMRHRWQPALSLPLCFESPQGRVEHRADAVLLALGGGSWARLGSNGAWVAPLQAAGVAVAALKPANCGFELAWSPHLAERHAGAPLKNVRLCFDNGQGQRFERMGECVLTATGLEGSLIYAASALLRDEILAHGEAAFTLDLLPLRSEAEVKTALSRGRGARSLANHFKEQLALSGAKAGLLREGLSAAEWTERSRDMGWLAARIKALPLKALAARPLDEAISSAGGVALNGQDAGLDTGLDAGLMLKRYPGWFCAGEMLDWEAPTGGYLLTAAMASGRVAAQAVLARLHAQGAAGKIAG